jgi:DNA-binding PadR family transcriptional regulator
MHRLKADYLSGETSEGVMGEKHFLGEFEQMVLLAVLRLGEEAYAVPIRIEIAKRARRRVSRGALYITLQRLEEKGLLTSRMVGGAEERGGRPRRYYRLRPVALTALKHSRTALLEMWKGLEAAGRKA